MNDQEKKIYELSSKIREDPAHTNDERNKLIRYLQSDDSEVSGFTAMRISSLSEDYPEPICGKSDKLAEIFISSESPFVRRELAKSFKNLAESDDCINKYVVEGMNEAIKIRSDKFWETKPRKEESTVKHGIEGWLAILDKSDYEIPREVVKSIGTVIPVFKRRTLIRSIKLFKSVCLSEIEGKDLALRYLTQMTNEDNDNISLRAMSALVELSLNGVVEENKVLDIINSNYKNEDVPEADLIEEFLQKHSDPDE